MMRMPHIAKFPGERSGRHCQGKRASDGLNKRKAPHGRTASGGTPRIRGCSVELRLRPPAEIRYEDKHETDKADDANGVVRRQLVLLAEFGEDEISEASVELRTAPKYNERTSPAEETFMSRRDEEKKRRRQKRLAKRQERDV